MNRPLPIGIEDFKKLRDNDFYYVDKSMFIKELLDKRSGGSLVMLPRRFGKNLGLSMLKY
ncbi:AAA family ATPase [Eisenbergiella porci]|uniref:AAA family ATPase n=1 Tax=Eisenbergiella porci TaxID=2652274 RepID=UPI002A80C15C|nr:AAA family ATPase [Eisenbergiella porci]